MTTSLFGKDILDLQLLSEDEIRLIMDTTARYEKVMQNGGRLMNLYGKTLAAGASYTYYRWIAGSTNVPALTAEQINSSTAVQTASTLSAKTTALGKVYHVNVEWNGTNFAYVGTQWAEGSLNTLNISKEASTGLETLTSQGIQVRGGKGEIRIDSPLSLGRGAKGEVAYVYNVSGMLVRTLLLPLQGAGGQVSVPAGIYIVRIGNGAEKVLVR